MRNFTWNRFPIKNLLIDSLLIHIVESTYLNRDMCKFESSQKNESRWQSTDSSKAYRNASAFKWRKPFRNFWVREIAVMNLFRFDVDKPWNYLWCCYDKGTSGPVTPLSKWQGTIPPLFSVPGHTTFTYTICILSWSSSGCAASFSKMLYFSDFLPVKSI